MQQLKAEKREITGKKVKTLREKGVLPAVLYGGKNNSETISVSTNEFMKTWKVAGESSLVGLAVDGGKTHTVLIHDVAVDPVSARPVHVDFFEVAANRPIRTHVPIIFDGESEAVKSHGGVLLKVMHELEIEALPKDLPHEIRIDLSVLKTFDDTIVIGNVTTPHGVTIVGASDATIAKVNAPRTSEELAAELETPSDVNLEQIEVEKKGKKEEASEDEANSSSE